MTNHLTLEQWIQYGVDHDYAEGFCYMHDSAPMTDEEAKEYYEEGSDPCIPMLRVWL